jgi:hypothetical protein
VMACYPHIHMLTNEPKMMRERERKKERKDMCMHTRTVAA